MTDMWGLVNDLERTEKLQELKRNISVETHGRQKGHAPKMITFYFDSKDKYDRFTGHSSDCSWSFSSNNFLE